MTELEHCSSVRQQLRFVHQGVTTAAHFRFRQQFKKQHDEKKRAEGEFGPWAEAGRLGALSQDRSNVLVSTGLSWSIRFPRALQVRCDRLG